MIPIDMAKVRDFVLTLEEKKPLLLQHANIFLSFSYGFSCESLAFIKDTFTSRFPVVITLITTFKGLKGSRMSVREEHCRFCAV